jgi:hypothetical protein
MLQLRHYVRDVYKDVGLRAVLRRLFVVFLAPFRGCTFLKGKHNNIGQHSVLGVYTSTNHLRAIRAHSDHSVKEYLQIMIGGESVHPSSNVLDSMVNISLLKQHLWLLLGLLPKILSLRGSSVRKLVLICEYIVYRSTLAMLEELKTKPDKVVIADSFSPRMIAVIDFYRSISVDTEMIQHGLIQGPSRYRSHADIYSFWAEFEYAKVKHIFPQARWFDLSALN